MRRALFHVHLWVGLLTGLYISVVCVTGAALVFRIDMQRALHPHLFTPSSMAVADPGTVLESVRAAYPNDRVSGIDTPSTERPTYLAYVGRGSQFLTVLIDPATAMVLGELPDRSLVRTIQELHFNLLGGRTGRLVNGIGAMLLLTMCVTGFVIWWPGVANVRRGFTIDWRRAWRRVIWEAHRAIGVWTVAVIALWALTGLYFSFPSAFRAAVNAISPVTVVRSPVSPVPAAGGAGPTWRQLIDLAQERMPGQFVARIVVPYNERAAFQVLFSNRQPTPAGSALTSVYLDQYTGDVLAEPPRTGRTAGDVIMAWVAPLHVGGFGGSWVKVVWFVLGLGPPTLVATGFTMWWTRVVRKSRNEIFRKSRRP
jgi:uncharacterized iron-regulated membrane protein